MAVQEYNSYGSSTRRALSRLAWSDILHKQVQNKLFFQEAGFIGPDAGDEDYLDKPKGHYPILAKTELDGGGDKVTLPLLRQLSGAGVSGGTTLKATEEAINWYSTDVYLEQLRHASGYTNKMSKQRNKFHTKENISDLLTSWMAQEMDASVFDAFYRGYSAHVIAENSNASTTYHPNTLVQDGSNFQTYSQGTHDYSYLAAGDEFSVATLEAAATYAEDNNWNPVSVGGINGFVMIIHPYQLQQLREDSTWAQANREAMPRGEDNPIFTRAEGQYAGIYVHCTRKIETVSVEQDGSTSVANGASVRQAILMGGHSLGRVIGSKPEIIKRDDTDYNQIEAYGIDSIFGDARADWGEDTDTTPATDNQSSGVFATWSPNPITVN